MAKQQKKKAKKPAMSEAERLIKAQAGYTCAMPACGSSGRTLYHIDGNPANQDPANMLLFCAECHARAASGELDAETIGMIKQSVEMRSASPEDLEAMKNEVIARIEALVGRMDEPKMIDEAEWGTREPDPKIEVVAGQILILNEAKIVLATAVLRPLALALYASNMLNTALAVQVAIAPETASPIDAYNMAVILDGLGRKDEAEDLYRSAVGKDPSFAQAWANLGVLLREAGNPEESEKALRKAIEADASYAPAWSSLGILLNQTERDDEAEEAFRKATEINPGFAPAWSNLAGMLKDSGRVEDGESAYRKAVEVAPDDADLRNGLAYYLLEAGKPDEAETQVREALRLDPDCAYAHATLGLLLLQRGELDEGRAGYERAIELHPNDKPLRQKYYFEYGRALAAKGEVWHARKELTKALKVKTGYIPEEEIEAVLADL